MELRQLRYFHAVAEEGNLTRAAQRLYLSGPSLSQQIRLLEKELGAALFERSTAGMSLTAAGRALLPEAQAALDAAGRARHAVQAAVQETPAVLRIGASGCIPVALARCMRDVDVESAGGTSGTGPQVRVQFQDGSTADQSAGLAAGELDLGLLTAPFPAAGLDTMTVWREPMVVVMHRDHPLASLEAVEFADLVGEDLMLFRRELAPGHHDQVLDVCRRNGWEPRLRPQSAHPSVFQTQLGGGSVVALKAAWTPDDDPLLVRRPFTGDAPTVTLVAAWRAGRQDPALHRLLSVLRDHRHLAGERAASRLQPATV
ncbi:LysR substrate-binding domain-containing protein [Kitasatospora sp. RB6PN24]|uniref:LysR family transcriptional regulator n=1 Tax=Kitasatospora humi TaxID=2893891 RepID=UPI001E2D144D|nr:LysR substrate-binding domain-containing protein [Kitasatospora humi]MCC9311851.1 LysR substrate-binding domain-containing protein [Kitasatospora humi]